MKTTKRILALITALVLCLAPMALMIGAADKVEITDVGPCGHSIYDYTIKYGDETSRIIGGTADHCHTRVYANATEECDICGYEMQWPTEVRYTYHTYVISPKCVYCPYIHPDYQ